jgi:hypothetical protein
MINQGDYILVKWTFDRVYTLQLLAMEFATNLGYLAKKLATVSKLKLLINGYSMVIPGTSLILELYLPLIPEAIRNSILMSVEPSEYIRFLTM